MGTLTTPMFDAAGIGMGIMQSKQAAAQQRMQAELSADNYEAQALRRELEAREVTELGRLEQVDEVLKGRAERAEQTVKYAASGVSVNSGSAVEVTADKAAWTEYSRQKIEYKAAMESWGLQYDAQLLRRDAHNTRASGSSGGGNAGLILNAGKQISSILFK